MKVRLRYDNYQTPFVCLVCMWLLCILIFVWCGWCMGVLNLLFASTSVGANRSYCGSSYTSIMVWLMYVLCTYMFGVCVCVWCPWVILVMSLSHSLLCVHVRPSVHINHTPMLDVCMIVVCIWWVVSLWMWNVCLGWIYASSLLSFYVFLVMFVVKRLARSEIRGCCPCIDDRHACAWPEVTC